MSKTKKRRTSSQYNKYLNWTPSKCKSMALLLTYSVAQCFPVRE